ncbi:hypothetical protein Pst134EB_023923 [Puccinia striiformis f. sp. tritici]|uniref:Uncharacterized protein n=1 Tax=Puccinia striiformis f. sp. tritici PST-78 TaxID=1165861 RepID=A0A0L0VKM1_9BASI|nr:hypothetical protein Pst134EB_023923 [Puccinia striiformis f. sp. tritici]KNE99529.1 hypothetical protein PSTG_07242 [Puccinia striiformis f. sp. tritici PST-78]
MTSPVIDPQDPENKNIPSSSFNPPSPSLLPSSKSESENTTDLQSWLDSSKEISSLSAVTMNSNERFHLPELTRSNFLDSEGKVVSVLRSKDLYDLVLDKEEKRRDEKGQFIAKNKDPIRIHRLNQAHAIMYTQIHSSLTGRLSQNGGKICPIALWTNIQMFGASKKKANTFKAWFKLNHLELRANNIAEFTSEYWNCIATLQSLNEVIEPASLGHALLAKIPASLSHVRDAIIAAGSSSELVVSHETILHLLDSQLSAAIPKAKPQVTHNLPRPSESGEASALLTQKCPQGRHVPSPSHAAENCFSLHPENLTEYRKFMKAKQEAEAHLAMFVPPSMFNVETIDQPDNNVDDLVKSLGHLPESL